MKDFKMRIAVQNDPHYGFTENTTKIYHKMFSRTRKCLNQMDAILFTGDLGTNKVNQSLSFLRMVRRFVDVRIPILFVYGNHDYWNTPYRSISELNEWRKSELLGTNTHYLADSPILIGDYFFCGYDGWYSHPVPPTQDKEYMKGSLCAGDINPNYKGQRSDVHTVMSHRSNVQFGNCLEAVEESSKQGLSYKVIVSHFDSSGDSYADKLYGGCKRQFEIITDTFDFCFLGHSHKRYLKKIGKTIVHQAGSDYNQPCIDLLRFDGPNLTREGYITPSTARYNALLS